ncbi:MAG: AsmA family protein [Desulfobacterales bacterium]|nr:AsmA family protein [Desulfobacterales bacterium]
MRASKIFRWILYVVGGLIAGLIILLVVLAFVPITIDLSEYKGTVESAASLALGRPVKVDDKIVIATSLQPYFSLEGLRISNPEDFQTGDFLQMKEARIGVKVLPLLSGKVHITGIKVIGLTVLLVEDKKGAVNWIFNPATETEPKAPSEPKPRSAEREFELQSDSLVVADLLLEDISVDYRSADVKDPLQLKINECKGTMTAGKPLTLDIKGALFDEPYTTSIEIGSLKEFLEENRSWMEIKTEIAKTRFAFSGTVDLAQATQILKLKAEVAGDRLDSLNGLLDLDLPPLKSYRSAAQLTLKEKHAELSNFEVQVGQTKLAGKMTVDNSGAKSKSKIDLTAPLIQLDDFDVGDWSPEKAQSQDTAEKSQNEKQDDTGTGKAGQPSSDEDVAALLSPEVLGKYEVQLNVKVNKVLSGNDQLGSGSLTATLKDGRFSIDPLKLNIPGGSFALAASLKPDVNAPEASIRADMEKFDFGVLVRRANPKADMGGVINLEVDLKSSADSFETLMAKGNGYFDVSGRLENLEAGIIDLWAVNVIAAVVSQEKDASKINCVVGRFSMKDGILEPDILLIDTSKIRICGKGHVDFKKQQIDLKMAPTPKRAEYFSLATPIEVEGQFSDFGVGIQAGGLIGTAVRFVASPVTSTFKRLFLKELPADGNDVCALPIGPENRSVEVKGCR